MTYFACFMIMLLWYWNHIQRTSVFRCSKLYGEWVVFFQSPKSKGSGGNTLMGYNFVVCLILKTWHFYDKNVSILWWILRVRNCFDIEAKTERTRNALHFKYCDTISHEKKERLKRMLMFSRMLLYSFLWNHFHLTEASRRWS